MPVASQITPRVPFVTASEINSYTENNKQSGAGLSLWELAVLYESERSGLDADAVLGKMKNIVETLKTSLETPEHGDVRDRILPNQSHLVETGNKFLGGSFNKNIIKFVTRFMDIKTSMGVFVAAPTAGSCGCLSGTVFALAEELRLSDEDMAKAFLSAGLIGVIIAHHSTFAAELCGCQAECGAGSAMCAAACAGISGGSVKACLSAASMALQNVLGLVCDPVGNKVEVPCLGKNILAAFNAVASANMALAGFDEVIPLDETIAAMDSVGRVMPRELKCTGLGGLSTTKTSQKILGGI
jgi:L-serine dehydratase